MNSVQSNRVYIIHWVLFCFVIAGITGFYYRLAIIHSLPFNFSLINVRHAHSHLMFFGWASLFPLYLISTFSEFKGSATTLAKWSLKIILLLTLLTYPSFLMWGYKPVEIGNASLPISAILSGFVMIGWYIFIISYFKNENNESITPKSKWFEGALIALFLSSLGAWGVGVSGIMEVESLFIGKALTHSFLAVFTEGWILLFLLGLLTHVLKISDSEFIISPNKIIWLILIGSPLSFAFGMAEHTNANSIMLWARFGSLLISIALLVFLISLFNVRKKIPAYWLPPLLFLSIKTIIQFSIALFGLEHLTSDPTLRVLYLHILLLGAFTLAITGYLVKSFHIKPSYYFALVISVIVTIISLTLPTPIRPFSWDGIWIYYALAIAAVFPISAMIIIWWKFYKNTLT